MLAPLACAISDLNSPPSSVIASFVSFIFSALPVMAAPVNRTSVSSIFENCGFDAANMAEDPHQLAAALKLEHLYVVGHDIGGVGTHSFVFIASALSFSYL